MLEHAEKAGEPHALETSNGRELTASGEPRFEHSPQTFVGPVGTHVFVGVAERGKFDAITAPCVDHGPNKRGHCLIKVIQQEGCTVVFQHWIKSLTVAGYVEDARERRERTAAREHAFEPSLGRIGEDE